MAKIKVTCDSTCDLTETLYCSYHIRVLPLGVSMGDDFRYDNGSVTAPELYAYADRTGHLPKTSAIPVGDYENCFRKYVEQGYDVIHINISSAISSCWQNACIAARNVGHVLTVDSQSLSSGSGQLALLAVELAAADYTPEEIKIALDEMKQNLDVSFVVQTLQYLHKGGRCSGIAAFGADLLNLKPEVQVEHGSMHIGKKYRGSQERSILDFIRGKLQNQKNIQPDRIFVTHSGVPRETLDKAEDLIRSLQPFDEIIETVAGSTISSQCGPGCLGLSFFRTGK